MARRRAGQRRTPRRLRSGVSGSGVGLAAVVCLACASPKPVLYPNPHYQRVGEAAAQRDIAACRELARAHGAEGGSRAGQVAGETATGAAVGGAAGAASGAAVGAIAGSAGRGAAAGAAGGAAWSGVRALFGALLRPRADRHAVERTFVTRCLRERGYEVVGWQ